MQAQGTLRVLVIVFSFLSLHLSAQETSPDTAIANPLGLSATYGNKGFEFTTANNRFKLQLQSRLQFRVSTPQDQNPVSFDDFDQAPSPVLENNRARLKVGGHGYKPWLKYYWEYDVAGGNLLDFRVMIEKWEWLSFKVGQWKIEYNMERVVSSGKQQLVDRSIINRAFTVDRQQGVEIYGHLDGRGALDFSYWAAVLTGTGRSVNRNDDEHLMHFGRFQWNAFGREYKFSGSDLDLSDKPVAMIAVAGITNRGNYTRFSSSGGGHLEGFETEAPGQYRLNQLNLETALKYKGFSWQSELHHKEIIDWEANGATTVVEGYYAQAGYFFNQLMSWWPEPLELAVRQSGYYPNTFQSLANERESSLAANWFFNGHANKLTVEVSNFNYENLAMESREGWRLRLQWDISF